MVPYVRHGSQFSVSLDGVAEASHMAAVAPSARPSVKGNCQRQICWLYALSYEALVCVAVLCSSCTRKCGCSRPHSQDDEPATSTLLSLQISEFWISESNLHIQLVRFLSPRGEDCTRSHGGLSQLLINVVRKWLCVLSALCSNSHSDSP